MLYEIVSRREVGKSLILYGLSYFPLDSVFDVSQLAIRIKSITKGTIDDEFIVSILSDLESEGIVTHSDGLKYRLKKNIDVPDFSESISPAWEEFSSFLAQEYSDYDPYIDREAKNIFEWSILKLFIKFLSASGPSLENQLDLLPFENFKNIIDDYVGGRRLSLQLSKRYSDILCSYFFSKQPKFLNLIYDYYSGIINIDLVMREQEIPSIGFDDIRFLVVDTTFMVNLLCKTEPMHPLAVAVANKCKNSNIPLFYTSDTKKEMWGFINGSKKEMSGFSVSSTRYRPIRSQFVADFNRQQNMSWTDYMIILESWEKQLHDNWNIQPLSKELEANDIDNDIFHYVERTIPILDDFRNEERLKRDPHYQPRYRDETQIKHDAYCIGLVSRLRSGAASERTKLTGPWFLTFDSLLSTLNMAYFTQEGKFGFVIQPRTLLNYLLIYSKIELDELEKEEFAEAIIRSTIPSQDLPLTIDEYSRLVTYKIGLEEPDIKTVKEILRSSPLLEELKQALELDRGDEADATAYRIFSDEKFVTGIIEERKTKEKLQRVAAQLKEAKTELMKERTTREALERTNRQPVSITTNVTTNLEITIQSEVQNLINLLESQNAFQEGLLEKPVDISTKDKLKGWLEKVKGTIETTSTIGEGIKALLPYIVYLIGKVGGT